MFGKETMLPYFEEVGVSWSFEKRVALCQDLEIHEVWIDQLVGYLAFKEIEGQFFLADIQVSLSCRNKGIGTSLLQKTVEIAKSKGYSDICLQVFKTNPAICLYLRNGYEHIEEKEHMFVLQAKI